MEVRGDDPTVVETVSKMNDRFFGQWLALFVPFRRLEDFLVEDVAQSVPRRFQHLACAMHFRREYWRSLDCIRADMELEAHGDDHIANVLHLVIAQFLLVAMQNFSPAQKRLALGALRRVRHALDIRYGEDEDKVQQEESALASTEEFS